MNSLRHSGNTLNNKHLTSERPSNLQKSSENFYQQARQQLYSERYQLQSPPSQRVSDNVYQPTLASQRYHEPNINFHASPRVQNYQNIMSGIAQRGHQSSNSGYGSYSYRRTSERQDYSFVQNSNRDRSNQNQRQNNIEEEQKQRFVKISPIRMRDNFLSPPQGLEDREPQNTAQNQSSQRQGFYNTLRYSARKLDFKNDKKFPKKYEEEKKEGDKPIDQNNDYQAQSEINRIRGDEL